MAGLIAVSHADCVQSFEALLLTLQHPSRDLVKPEYSVNIRNEFGRYKVWAGNVGAAHQGRTYRLSLDYRLKDASFYQDRILELLTDLRVTLQRVTSLLNGESLPFDEQQGPLDPDTESNRYSNHDDPSDESSESSSSDGSGDGSASLRNIRALVANIGQKPAITSSEPTRLVHVETQERKTESNTEVGQAQEAIKDIVTSLYKIATVIRRPMPSDRHIKSAQTNVQHFAEYDQRYVSDKFPTANAEVLARLGRGITRRRQLLEYRELHTKRLNIAAKSEPSAHKETDLVELDRFPGVSTQIKTAPSAQNNRSQAPSTEFIPSTKATTFVPKNPMVIEEVQSVADTTSSYQSTASGREIVTVPPRPRGLDGEELEDFECPYCHVLCEIRSSNAWKHHVLSDLEPYMCTFLRCSKPDQMYASRLEWYQHELEEHRMEWFCNTAGHGSYQTQHEFKHHMAKDHASSVSNEHFSSLVHNFRRPLLEEGTQCSLCGNIPKSIQSHLARHQAQLALFAIPRRHYSDGGSEIDSATSGHGIARSSNTATSVNVNFPDNLEIGNIDNYLEPKSSESLSDIPIETSQYVIPDCEDEYWNLPANADGTDHWLNTGGKSKQQELEVGLRLTTMANLASEYGQQDRSSRQIQILAPSRISEDWVTFFKVTRDQLEGVSKEEIQRQNELHEIVLSEEIYMDRINVLRVLYRDDLASWQPPIIAENKLTKFVTSVFGKIEAIKDVNENYLLPQLKYRQMEQGPWIIGFSDIFREWIRKARTAYVEYAAGFPYAEYLVRKEAEKNLLFQQFLDQARKNKLSGRLDWKTHLKGPITRLQRYSLLLGTAHKKMTQDTEEKENLAIAIEEIKAVTLECDAKVGEQLKKVEMLDLQSKLYLRPGMERVELNLDHPGRELIFRGVLQRAGANRFTRLETHAFLFDHYLVLAKSVVTKAKSPAGREKDVYDVSKLPIPMSLLVLESTDKDLVIKSSIMGIGALTSVSTITSNKSSDPRLEHTISNESAGTTTAVTKLTPKTANDGDTRLMYPFRVKHLGKTEVYTLYAPSAQNRQDWCDKILEAKTRHAESLYEQNSEPFRLRVMADTAFANDAVSSIPRSAVSVKGTPLDRAISDMANTYGALPQPAPVCRAQVNCATAFNCYGKSLVAIGTNYGVYTSDAAKPRGWTRSIQIARVTQIAVLEEFSLCLIIADKALITYHLDVVIPVSDLPASDHARHAPQKLSGIKGVSFFAAARMKDRPLVFYMKREGLHSTFKVLEPVFQKSTEKKSRLFGKASGGVYEFFREFDEFYIPNESFTINLFHAYIAVSTLNGYELLTLDKKATIIIPDKKDPAIASIIARLAGQRPLGMFRLSEVEFFLCYEEFGVYVDKHGDVSRSVIMEFVGKAEAAAMYGAYLVLFNKDFVEIRNAENGRLRQVIAGEDVRCLDYGINTLRAGPTTSHMRPAASGSKVEMGTLKIAMAHPDLSGHQLVLEMVLNDGQRD